MYRWMSFFRSSLAKKSIWAMTTLDRSGSTSSPRKMIRSFSSRE